MDKKFEGTFSLGYFSLKMQLQNLFEDAGGESAVALMDAISNVAPAKRDALLKTFTEVAKKVAAESSSNQQAENSDSNLEEALYSSIMGNLAQNGAGRHLEVVSGGKDKQLAQKNRTLISLEEARKSRKGSVKPFLN